MSRTPRVDPEKDASPPMLGGPFRIHVVAEMTGIPEPTLRAWERRYGIPSPERTATGYRLYSVREVEQVRAMRAACDGGMSAAEAARWVRSGGEKSTPTRPILATESEDRAFDLAQKRLLDAIERLSDEDLEQHLRHAMFLGNATTILDEVLSPTLVEVGRLWHDGKLTIAHEHFASQRFATALRDLVRLSSASAGATEVLLASFADDEHELGLLGLAIRLGTWGFRPVLLGARTPPEALASAVASIDPGLVGLSVTIAPEPERARSLIEGYAAACGDTPWVVGGPGVNRLAELVGGAGGLVASSDPQRLRTMIFETLDARRKRDPQACRKGKKT